MWCSVAGMSGSNIERAAGDAAQPVQRPVLDDPHGSRAGVEDLRGLLCGQADRDAQHQHRTLARGEPMQQMSQPLADPGRERAPRCVHHARCPLVLVPDPDDQDSM